MSFFPVFILSMIYTYIIAYCSRRQALEESYKIFHKAIEDQIKSEERKNELKMRVDSIFKDK